MRQIDIREGARRQHRGISLFAMIQCWSRGLDGIAFERSSLERLLGLERFKETRMDWMIEDFSDIFPYHKKYYTMEPKSFSSLMVSRKELDGFVPKGSMSTDERISKITEGGPVIEKFKIWKIPEIQQQQRKKGNNESLAPIFGDDANFDERLLNSYLSLLISGQISIKSLPPLE